MNAPLNLDEDTAARLRRRAERHGRSVEAEAGEILREALAAEASPPVGAGLLDGRVAVLDDAAAAAASLEVQRVRSVRRVEAAGTLIAGIALSQGATVATRNVRHFADVPGLAVVDPFEA